LTGGLRREFLVTDMNLVRVSIKRIEFMTIINLFERLPQLPNRAVNRRDKDNRDTGAGPSVRCVEVAREMFGMSRDLFQGEPSRCPDTVRGDG
jgi:hypothetical protein